MPLPYAPSLPPPVVTPGLPSPILAPGVSSPVPFIRPGLPAVPPVVPSPVPALPPMAAPIYTPVTPAAGGLARVAPQVAAAAGALGLGLLIGNALYEDVLRRPFGPSLADLLLPQAQPEPLPAPSAKFGIAACPVGYSLYVRIIGVITANGWTYDTGPKTPGNSRETYTGPIGPPFISSQFTGRPVVYVLSATQGLVSMGSVLGVNVTQLIPLHTRMDGSTVQCLEPLTEPLKIPSALPQRQGEPGQLPYLPEPLRLPQPERPRYLPPGPLQLPEPLELPNPERDREFEPLLLPSPWRMPWPLLNPFPNPDPVPQPDPDTNPDGSPRRPPPPTPSLECCPSLELKLDELINRPEIEECDLTEIEALLREILEQLGEGGNGSLDLTPCDSEESIFTVYQGQGLAGIYNAISAITQSLSLIHTNTKCYPESAVAAVPDWWQVRLGANRPQLSVIYRKGEGRNYHAINIPHPKVNPRPAASPLSAYIAGNYQATLVCIDNSKFIVNAISRSEAERIALEAAAAIEPQWLGAEINLSITERRGSAVSVGEMIPRYMQYFPEGQQSRMPLWRVSF